jgi:parallel beta-helix repeat protein
MRKKRNWAGVALLGAALAAAVWLQAGDLNPPVGPIQPTMKTLDQVEPRIPISTASTPGDADSVFKITQSGSYYLTGNVQGVAGKMGIEVVASHVTIDLRGFEMVGVAGSLAGIDLNNGAIGNIFGITIRDGTIRGWGSDGIKGNQSGEDHFENLELTAITGHGIYVNTNTTIDHCHVYACSLDGILTSNNVLIQNTVAANNSGGGISAGTNSNLVNCEGYGNAANGLIVLGGRGTLSNCNATLNGGTGISAGDGGSILHCHANENSTGIAVGEGGVVSNCTANDNTVNGITAGGTSTVVACSAWSNNAIGISVDAGTVTSCTARENGNDGISALNGSLVDGCTTAANADDGITVGFGSIVTRCTSRANTGDGISCASDCRIADNTCDGNGAGTGDGAGIHVTSSDCRIEGNNVTDNDRGIDVDIAGNLIVRNSASGNATNYEIVAGNKVGPIVLAPDSVAISGDTGGAGVGTTNPWANVTY